MQRYFVYYVAIKKKLFQKLDQIGYESSTYTIKGSIVNTYIYKDIKNYFSTYINLKFGWSIFGAHLCRMSTTWGMTGVSKRMCVVRSHLAFGRYCGISIFYQLPIVNYYTQRELFKSFFNHKHTSCLFQKHLFQSQRIFTYFPV